MTREKIIIDTDIGDDIDDALAIVLALRSPEIELLGITTVFRNTEARSKIASRLLEVMCAEHVQVYTGCAQPMSRNPVHREVPNQYDDSMKGVFVNQSEHAVDYLIREVLQSHGDITLVAIGPLTNIAQAFLKCPEMKAKVKRVVLMGGAFYFHYREWNMLCDPEAAQVVFESHVEIRAVGLDVTKYCQLDAERLSQIRNMDHPLAEWMDHMIERWQRHQNRLFPLLHDALTICAVFRNELLTWEREKILVETKGEYTRGFTFNASHWYRVEQIEAKTGQMGNGCPIYVAKEVKVDRFMELFMERLCNENQHQTYEGC